MQGVLLLIVLALAAPLFVFAAPVLAYVVPLIAVGLVISVVVDSVRHHSRSARH